MGIPNVGAVSCLSLMARTKKSHEYRNYFIACEEKLKEKTQGKLPSYSEALRQLVSVSIGKEAITLLLLN